MRRGAVAPRPRVALPWGSQSTSRTRFSSAASAAARLIAVGRLADATLLVGDGENRGHSTAPASGTVELQRRCSRQASRTALRETAPAAAPAPRRSRENLRTRSKTGHQGRPGSCVDPHCARTVTIAIRSGSCALELGETLTFRQRQDKRARRRAAARKAHLRSRDSDQSDLEIRPKQQRESSPETPPPIRCPRQLEESPEGEGVPRATPRNGVRKAPGRRRGR